MDCFASLAMTGFKQLTPLPPRYSLASQAGKTRAQKIREDAMTSMLHRGYQLRAAARTVFLLVASALLTTTPALTRAASATEIPTFAVDASWPKPLPNNWILGQVGGITVDWQGHIWVIHRPRSLTDDEKGAALTPPRSKCCISAPPVLEFDTDGNLLRSWGGPGEGYQWVGREHGIEVDEKGFVWVGGNADNDNAILKFTLDGKFVSQIGSIAPSKRLQRHHAAWKARRDRDRQGGQRDLCRRRLRQSPRHRVRRHDRRLQAALGRLWQQARRRQAAAL